MLQPLPLPAALTPEAEVRSGGGWWLWYRAARRAAVGVSPAVLQVRPGPSGGRGGLGGRGERPEGLGRLPGPRCFLPAVTPGPGWEPAQLGSAAGLPLFGLSLSGTPCSGQQDCHPPIEGEVTKYSTGPAANKW